MSLLKQKEILKYVWKMHTMNKIDSNEEEDIKAKQEKLRKSKMIDDNYDQV